MEVRLEQDYDQTQHFFPAYMFLCSQVVDLAKSWNLSLPHAVPLKLLSVDVVPERRIWVVFFSRYCAIGKKPIKEVETNGRHTWGRLYQHYSSVQRGTIGYRIPSIVSSRHARRRTLAVESLMRVKMSAMLPNIVIKNHVYTVTPNCRGAGPSSGFQSFAPAPPPVETNKKILNDFTRARRSWRLQLA